MKFSKLKKYIAGCCILATHSQYSSYSLEQKQNDAKLTDKEFRISENILTVIILISGIVVVVALVFALVYFILYLCSHKWS